MNFFYKLVLFVSLVIVFQSLSIAKITRHLYKYDFSDVAVEKLVENSKLSKGFIFEFSLSNALKEKSALPITLIDFPKSFSLKLAKSVNTYYNKGNTQNLSLQAFIYLTVKNRPTWKSMFIELPLNAVEDLSKHTYALVYDGVKFFFTVDGVVIDKNYPAGMLDAPQGDVVLNVENLKSLKFSTDVSKIKRKKITHIIDKSIQYYSPYGHNTNFGDASVFYHDGVFHLLYLFDRNHHRCRWGGGAHVFYHLTSRDFINWEDYGAMVEITEFWQSVGTGTMFYHNGKYYSAFGWHTSRVVEHNKTVSAKFGDNKSLTSKVVTAQQYGDLIPSGFAMAESDDGINFTWNRNFYGISENPSIFKTCEGLKLFAGYGGRGIWSIPSLNGVWTKDTDDFPILGENSPMRNTGECPSYFEWNGYKYFLMGATGYWKGKIGDKFVDMASQGIDIYDGLAVPFVAPFKDNRMIISGWLHGDDGWGSVHVCRELVQYPDGNLGMKWVKELQPKNNVKICDFSKSAKFDFSKSITGQMNVIPQKKSKFALRFKSSKNPERNVEFQIDFDKNYAQIRTHNSNEFAPILPTIRQIVKESTSGCGWFMNSKNKKLAHYYSRNFLIENLKCVDKPFELRFIVRKSPKYNANILDFEIAQSRTMVSFRKDVDFDEVEIVYPDKYVSNATLYEYENEEYFGCGGN